MNGYSVIYMKMPGPGSKVITAKLGGVRKWTSKWQRKLGKIKKEKKEGIKWIVSRKKNENA